MHSLSPAMSRDQLFKSRNIPLIADFFLNKCLMRTHKHTYRICEVEFYIHHSEHEDHYVHLSKNLLRYGKLYFHEFKNGSFMEGNYKGMDFVFGDESKNHKFAILVRSVLNINTNHFTEGPSKTVSLILEEYGHEKVRNFWPEVKNTDIFEAGQKIWIEERQDLKQMEVWAGDRIGLSDKYPEFKTKAYRYLIMPNKIKKGKKSLMLVDNSKHGHKKMS